MSTRKEHQELLANYQRLMNYKNAAGLPLYNLRPSKEVKVEVFPDKSVARARFLPHDSKQGLFRAHPQTIAAMKKDLFMAEKDEFVDLQKVIKCSQCHQELDLQFWKFCPFCEAKFETTHQ